MQCEKNRRRGGGGRMDKGEVRIKKGRGN